jgi:hypothetical protein
VPRPSTITPIGRIGFEAVPDRSDRQAWKEYWRLRQEAIPLDFQGDLLAWQEVEFYERFVSAGHEVVYIPPRGLPGMPDFVWRDHNGLRIELKTPLVAVPSYTSVSRMIRKDAPAKRVFMIDFRDRDVPPALLDELRAYNLDPHNARSPIDRLFVFNRGRVFEVHLKQSTGRTPQR